MIYHGDCLEILKTLPDNSVDSVVTDPPYGLSFMGKKWDYDVPSIEIWQECLRVLKPGGHLLSFAGTRTQHRMAVRIEDAGFEIRDMIAWIYGSGFPKSTNIAIRIDKEAGKMEARGKGTSFARKDMDGKILENGKAMPAHKGITEEAKQWEGWGTALKPALEPITVARKPLIGTVAENVLTHGTGGLNIDGSRVGLNGEENPSINRRTSKPPVNNVWTDARSPESYAEERPSESLGRWPANLIHDGSEEVLECFPNTGSAKKARNGIKGGSIIHDGGCKVDVEGYWPADTGGSAARFFYCAKASKKDRDEGLEGFEEKQQDESRIEGNPGGDNPRNRGVNKVRNFHPTVKPTELMRYLVKLVTPKGGTVLDPFTGSGSTGKACKLEGFEFIGIEREEEYVKIAEARIEAVNQQPVLV